MDQYYQIAFCVLIVVIVIYIFRDKFTGKKTEGFAPRPGMKVEGFAPRPGMKVEGFAPRPGMKVEGLHPGITAGTVRPNMQPDIFALHPESFVQRPGMKIEGFASRPGMKVESFVNRTGKDWDASTHENLTNPNPTYSGLNWQESLARGLDPKIWDRQEDFINNVKRFGGSSVQNFEIEEMSRFASTVNFLGLKRPAYVRVNETNPFQPEEDTGLFKMFKRVMI